MRIKLFPRFFVNNNRFLLHEDVGLCENFESSVLSYGVRQLFQFTRIHPTEKIFRFQSSIEFRNKEVTDSGRNNLSVQSLISFDLDKHWNLDDSFHKAKSLKLLILRYIEKFHSRFTKVHLEEFRKAKEPRINTPGYRNTMKSIIV